MEQMIEYRAAAALLKASWQATVIILLVLAAQRAFGRRLSPRWRYGLWLLVVLRLALPWTISSPVSLFNLTNLAAASAAPAGTGTAPASRPLSPGQSAPARATQPGKVTSRPPAAQVWWSRIVPYCLLGSWAVGALALTTLLLVTHYRFSRRVARQRPLINADVMNLLEDCKQVLGVRVPVTLVETVEVGSPALFGFMRPRLLLPVDLTRGFSLQELRYVFLHELSHIKRHDILVGWVVTALQIAHWFNPLVWLGFRRMRLDRELACDAMALRHVREEENQDYGNTIIKLLEGFGRSAWAPNLAGTIENRNQTRERISMIAKFKRTDRWPALAATLFIGLGLATLTDAEPPGSQLAKDLVGTWILVGEPGHVGAVPAEGGRIKSLTHTHWSVTQTEPGTGLVLFHHGGTYTVKGNEYDEHVEYANETTKELIGHTSRFKVKLEGDTLTLLGIGNPWREVWKRASASTPRKADAATLQGTWTGRGQGKEGEGTASLVVHGASLEFHGADTNEWYKATFALFDTTPKQLVATITEASVPQMVGLTSYAIYRLEDGTLTISGNAPGMPVPPASFDAPGARKFVLRRK